MEENQKYEIDENGINALKKIYEWIMDSNKSGSLIKSIDDYIELSTPIIKGEKRIPLLIGSEGIKDHYDFIEFNTFDEVLDARRKYNLYLKGEYVLDDERLDVYEDLAIIYYNGILTKPEICLDIIELYESLLNQIDRLDENTQNQIMHKIGIGEKEKMFNKRVYRKMSMEEFEKYLNGEELIAFKEPGMHTSAKTPTFYFAESMWELVPLTVSISEPYVLCEFEANKFLFKKGTGTTIYSYEFELVTEEIEHQELYLDKYNNQKLKLTNCAYFGESTEEHKNTIDFIDKFDSYGMRNEHKQILSFMEEDSDRVSDAIEEYIHDKYGYGRILSPEVREDLRKKDSSYFLYYIENKQYNQYDEEEYYDEYYDEESYTPEEIEEGIEVKESDVTEVMEEIIKSEKQENDKDKNRGE